MAKEENYIYVVSAQDFEFKYHTLSGTYKKLKDAKEHLFDGFNGEIHIIRTIVLDSINKWLYLIEVSGMDAGKIKYIVKIEKSLLK